MKKAAAKTTNSASGDDTFTVLSIGLQFLDTTWRIAVPVLIMTALGIFIDLHLGTKPWVTLLLVVAGFAMAAALVKKQLAAVDRRDNKNTQQSQQYKNSTDKDKL